MPTMRTLHTVRGHRARLMTVTTAALLVLALLALPALAHAGHHPSHDTDRRAPALSRSAPGVGAQLAQVRAATARYHDVEVALADGYDFITPCVPHPGGAGAMGHHYVNWDLTEVDPLRPQALLYIPDTDGRLRLVGVEYIDTQVDPEHPTTLFGQEFTDGVPNLSDARALHVWLWQANPAGMFASFNPNLSCPAG